MKEYIKSLLPEGFTIYGFVPHLQTYSTDTVGSPDIIKLRNMGEHGIWETEGVLGNNVTTPQVYALRDGSPIAWANGMYPESCALLEELTDLIYVGMGRAQLEELNEQFWSNTDLRSGWSDGWSGNSSPYHYAVGRGNTRVMRALNLNHARFPDGGIKFFRGDNLDEVGEHVWCPAWLTERYLSEPHLVVDEPVSEPEGEQPPLVIQIGRRYVRRDGAISGEIYDSDYGQANYPLVDRGNGFSYTATGHYWVDHTESGLDLIREHIEVGEPVDSSPPVASIRLRFGGYYRSADGIVVGPLVSTTNSQYPFGATYNEYITTWTSDGRYDVIGYNPERNLVAEVPEHEVPDPDQLIRDHAAGVNERSEFPLPLRAGDTVMCINGTLRQVVFVNEDGTANLSQVAIVNAATGVRSNRDLSYIHTVREIVRRDVHIGVTYECFPLPEVPEGYTGWMRMGHSVDKDYDNPWVYKNTSGVFGSIKSSVQSLDAAAGCYYEAYKAYELPDEPTVLQRKKAASFKAYVKYWSRYAETEPDSPAVRVNKFFVREFGDPDWFIDGNLTYACYDSETEAMMLSKDTHGHYKCSTIRYAKLYTGIMKQKTGNEVTDEDRRLFTQRFDRAMNDSGVVVEWSDVSGTYCTPMHGWEEDGSVTGSCMEKFCDGENGAGHDVFDVYCVLERKGFLKMIRIEIDEKYLGRVICWKHPDDNGWIMDRVYCKQERGDTPPKVKEALAAFAVENSILGRTDKCGVHALPRVSLKDISCTGLAEFDHYPYFDTYAGVSSSGIHTDNSRCRYICDDADGDYSGGDDEEEEEEEEEEETYEVRNRGEEYTRDEITWSSYHDEWIHDDDVVTSWDDEILHCDETEALGPDGEDGYAHRDAVVEVRLPTGNGRTRTFYALEA